MTRGSNNSTELYNVVLETTYYCQRGKNVVHCPTITTVIIVNLEKWLIIHNGKLCNVCYGMVHCSMPMQWMPVGTPKVFKMPVNSFMTCPSQGIHFLFPIVISSRHLCPLSSIVIPSIYHTALMIIH